MNDSQDTNAVSQGLSHVDERGQARMVDVGSKPISERTATAMCQVEMSREAAEAIRSNAIVKGDCIQVARIAAIQSSKLTSQLIPLCHPIALTHVRVDCQWISETILEWRVSVHANGQTGVEMEALTAASIAALTTYDMCKSIDRAIRITNLQLVSKSGGVRGDYSRNET